MRRLICLSVFLLTACAGFSEDVGKADLALSHPGPWDIPADTMAVGDTQYVNYTSAGPWVGSSGCGGSLLSGTARLRDWVGTAFPQVTHVGGYSCRSINGDGTRMSVHATGRALDIMLPLHGGEADNDLGDPIGNYLIEHAEEIGIQLIIWDRWTWNASRTSSSKERSYGGAHPHHDHLHVELSVEAAAERTPWFSGGMPLPESACAALPAEGGVVEETSDCFAAYGPATYWRSESMGHGGSMLWTNAYQGSSPSNWARWHFNLAEGGEYAVEIWAEQPYAAHRATRYALRHGDVDHSIDVDLNGAMGWVRLGTYTFAPGAGQHLSVYDNYGADPGSDQHIPADAVRLVRIDGAVDPDPMPDPDPAPDPGPDPGPDPRVLEIVEIAPTWSIIPIAGGDPALDDDPLVGPGRDSVGGCSVSAASSGGAAWPLAFLVGFALLRRRR